MGKSVVLVDLQGFIRTGVLGLVHLGMTDAEVRRILGEPDGESCRATDLGIPYICKYGDIELYFEQVEEVLVSIQTDPSGVPSGGKQIDLDPWIIRGGLPIEEAEIALRTSDIPFARRPFRSTPHGMLLMVSSGVEIGFYLEQVGHHGPRAGLNYLARSEIFTNQ